MKKTIVFICFDDEYVNAIEYKFSHLVERKADVVFITNLNALNDYITKQPEFDILIAPSECEINEIRISKDIKLYYLTDIIENADNPQYIYKYCSAKTMVEKIGSELLVQDEQGNEKETKIIGIISAAGGTGNTVMALSVAHGLRKKGNRVLYISTVPYQDYSYYLKCNSYLSNNFCYQCSVNIKGAVKMLEQEIKNDEFDYMPPFKNLPISYHIDFSSYVQFIDYFRKNNLYDFIVIEVSTEPQLEKISFLKDCYKCVMVTTQDKTTVQKTKAFLSGIVDKKNNLLMVCNKYCKEKTDYLFDSGLLEKYELGDYVKEYSKEDEWIKIRDLNIAKKIISCF